MSSRDPFDEIQILGTKEADVSFRIELLHHVLLLDKIPGKKKHHQNCWEDFVRISLKQANKTWVRFIRK